MLPQLGNGSCTPSPKKLRPDSVRIAPPIRNVADTMTGAIAFGRMCLKIILALLAPSARAASTNSCSRKDRNWPLTILASPGHEVSPITSIMLKILLSTIDTIVISKKKVGNDMTISVNRMRILSIAPPKYPANAPITVPSNTATPAATNPTDKLIRLPHITRLKRSLPMLSVPIQCSWEGACSLLGGSVCL